jgi:hypothetical protein
VHIDYEMLFANEENYVGLDSTLVLAITDTSAEKIGKYCPGSRIKIEHDHFISTLVNPFIYFTAWNIPEEVKLEILNLNRNASIIEI